MEGRVTEIHSQIVLSEEGRREAELQRANREARQREREARETAAVAAKQQQLQRRAQVGSGMAFSGNKWPSIIFNQLLTCDRIIGGDEAGTAARLLLGLAALRRRDKEPTP